MLYFSKSTAKTEKRRAAMLEFRALTDSDIPMLEKWLNREHVKKWYEIPRLNVTIDDWVSEISRYKTDFKWIHYLIVMLDGHPIGLCLYYKCEDSSDEEFGLLPTAGSYGIDYLIGEEAQLGKGLGKALVGMLVEKIFSFQDALRVTADIDKDNTASERTLLACGFKLSEPQGSRYVILKEPAARN